MSDERYALVPVVATADMCDNATGVLIDDGSGGMTCLEWSEATEVWSAMLSAAPPPDDAVIERVARGLCEQQIRHARRFDTPPAELEALMSRGVDYAWKDFIPPATTAIAALCGGRVDG